MRGRRILLLAVVCLWAAPESRAQTTGTTIETRVQRDVSQYRWLMGLETEHVAGDWRLRLRNQFFSDGFILLEDRLRFRDENQLAWSVERPINTSWRSLSDGRLAYFSQSRVLIQQALSGVEYTNDSGFSFRPSLGLAWDQRPGALTSEGFAPLRSDAGPAVALQTTLAPRLSGPYSLSMQGSGSWHSISPRRGYTVSVRTNGGGRFEETSLDARFRYGGARRDVYQAASFLNRGLPTGLLSETVEATRSDTLGLGLAVDAPISSTLRLEGQVDGTLMRRFIRTHHAPNETLYFDTDFSRRAVDVSLALAFDNGGSFARVMLELGADAEERRLANRDRLPPAQAVQKSVVLQQADFERSLVALRLQGRTHIGPRLSAHGESVFSILRRDTPDANPDDRDEAYHSASAGLAYRWSRHLEAEVNVFGSYFHTVYLNALRSAENNIQRSLRLRPLIRWQPDERSRIVLSSEVRATYTVDDFVLPGRRPSDQSARELRYGLDLERDIGYGVRVLGQFGYTDLRLGRLLWDSFAEIPFDTLRTYNGWIRVQGGRRVVSELGLRFFIRTDFSRAVSLRYPSEVADGRLLSITRPGREWIRQLGPTSAITAQLGGGSEIRLTGWLNVQRVYYQIYGALPDEDESAIRRAAREGSRIVVPNLSLSVRWDL